jgi:hypothetical protein
VLLLEEEKELFCFVDGRFAFSLYHANYELVRKRART